VRRKSSPDIIRPIPKAAGDEKWQVSAAKGTVAQLGRGTMAEVKIRAPVLYFLSEEG